MHILLGRKFEKKICVCPFSGTTEIVKKIVHMALGDAVTKLQTFV